MEQHRGLHEMRRQNAVVLYGLAGAERKNVDTAELEAVTETLKRYLGADYTGVHILDDDLQVTLAASEDPEPAPVPRGDSMCSAVLDRHGEASLLEIPDASTDPSLRDNPFVNGEQGSIRFYAAAPLRTPGGLVLGTLCAIGHEERTLDDDERLLLLHLGYAVVHVLERHMRGTGQRRAGAPPADG